MDRAEWPESLTTTQGGGANRRPRLNLRAATGGARRVIPLPAKIVRGSGVFEVNSATSLRVAPGDRDALSAARYLAALWKRTNGLTLPVSPGAPDQAASVILFQTEPGFGPEAYRLEVASHGITVSATTAAGLFYGAVTLWQLLPPGPTTGQIAAQTILDEPRYPWRGLMLDSARHFQSPAFVRSMIDWMAWHKLNVLQWHLTDDQGLAPADPQVSEAHFGGGVADSGRRSRRRAGTAVRWVLHSGTGARDRGVRGHSPCADHSRNRYAGPCASRDRGVPVARRRRTVTAGVVPTGACIRICSTLSQVPLSF